MGQQHLRLYSLQTQIGDQAKKKQLFFCVGDQAKKNTQKKRFFFIRPLESSAKTMQADIGLKNQRKIGFYGSKSQAGHLSDIVHVSLSM